MKLGSLRVVKSTDSKTVHQKYIQMTFNLIKRCSASIIREIKIHWDTVSHLSGWWKWKAWQHSTGSCGKTGTLRHCWWECKMVQSLRRGIWKNYTNIYWLSAPVISLPGIHLWRYISKSTKHMQNVIILNAVLFIIVIYWK